MALCNCLSNVVHSCISVTVQASGDTSTISDDIACYIPQQKLSVKPVFSFKSSNYSSIVLPLKISSGNFIYIVAADCNCVTTSSYIGAGYIVVLSITGYHVVVIT